jgi:hypothetical protein
LFLLCNTIFTATNVAAAAITAIAATDAVAAETAANRATISNFLEICYQYNLFSIQFFIKLYLSNETATAIENIAAAAVTNIDAAAKLLMILQKTFVAAAVISTVTKINFFTS